MGKYFLHSMKNKICYWSIGSGDYSFMIQNLIYSKNLNKVEGDFIAFSDKKLKNCINQTLDPEIPLSLDNYMFKFAYLKKLIHFDYDYFVFIDADTLFVKKPNICPSFFVQDAPWHCFLESPINSNKTKRKDKFIIHSCLDLEYFINKANLYKSISKEKCLSQKGFIKYQEYMENNKSIYQTLQI